MRIPIRIDREKLGEMLRFGLVGVLAVAIHYAVYWLLQYHLAVNIAYTIGYLVSFMANYCLSARFTFRQQTSAANGAGFAVAHVFNYFLQLGLFNAFLWAGLSRSVAPLAVLVIAVPSNFLIVRFIFKHFSPR